MQEFFLKIVGMELIDVINNGIDFFFYGIVSGREQSSRPEFR